MCVQVVVVRGGWEESVGVREGVREEDEKVCAWSGVRNKDIEDGARAAESSAALKATHPTSPLSLSSPN
jgi:hypothetical protein